MKQLIFSLSLLFSTLVLQSQTGKYCIYDRFSQNAFFDSADITIKKNVVYSIPKKWPGTGVDTLKLDLYYPSGPSENLSKRPLIVFLYGGAWIKGSKDDAGIKQKCFEWARRGFVVAAPNYRLSWNCAAADLFQVCVLCQGNYYDLNTAIYRGAQDAKAAMRFMVTSQTTYGIDTSAMFIGGESAGSFNANHAAHWDHNYATKIFNGNPYKILGSIDSSGSNIGVPFRIKGVINSCGAVLNDTGLKFRKIPTVFFHDELDCVVPYKINKILNCCATSFATAKGSFHIYDELTKTGVSAEMHTIPGLTPSHCSYPNITLVNESSCFIKKILCGMNVTGSSNHPAVPAVNCNALQATGIKTISAKNIILSPQPSDQKMILKGISLIDVKTIKVFTLDGKEKSITFDFINQRFELNTQDLQTGIYILKIETPDRNLLIKKMVVAH